jgi:hypothetical protein
MCSGTAGAKALGERKSFIAALKALRHPKASLSSEFSAVNLSSEFSASIKARVEQRGELRQR